MPPIMTTRSRWATHHAAGQDILCLPVALLCLVMDNETLAASQLDRPWIPEALRNAIANAHFPAWW